MKEIQGRRESPEQAGSSFCYNFRQIIKLLKGYLSRECYTKAAPNWLLVSWLSVVPLIWIVREKCIIIIWQSRKVQQEWRDLTIFQNSVVMNMVLATPALFHVSLKFFFQAYLTTLIFQQSQLIKLRISWMGLTSWKGGMESVEVKTNQTWGYGVKGHQY